MLPKSITIKNTRIQPHQVVRAWSLCPHLAQVLELLGSFSYEEDINQNLKRAKNNLIGEIKKFKEEGEPCATSFPTTQPFTFETILCDWNLTFHLTEALSHIRAYQQISNDGSHLKFIKEEMLHQALDHIKAEIKSYPGNFNKCKQKCFRKRDRIHS